MSEFEWGLVNGKRLALRWLLGIHDDFLEDEAGRNRCGGPPDPPNRSE